MVDVLRWGLQLASGCAKMDGHFRTALIAEVDERFRQVLRQALTERLGLAVVEARSLADAVERLSVRRDIGLAALGLDLPGMTGAWTLLPLRARRPDLKIAVTSGSEERRDILLALDGGMHGFLPRSLPPEDLTKALRAILDGLIYVPPVLARLDGQGVEDHRAGEADDAAEGAGADAARPGMLTPRQREVLELLVQGKSNKEIARALSLGQGTVKVHMSALFRSLGATSRSAAAVSGARLLQSRLGAPVRW